MSLVIRVNTRRHPYDVPICEGCMHLELTEWEQRQRGGGQHRCTKYDRQLKHLGLHPHLPRLPECVNENGYEYQKITLTEQEINEHVEDVEDDDFYLGGIW